MKTLKIMTLGIMMFFASNSINAQVSVSVNLGIQPHWGPVGYASVNYYYLPDVEAYYDIRATQFIFLSNGVWIRSSNLPRQYRGYDLNRGYKVVLNDYHGSRPYSNYRYDRVKYYKGYKKGHHQKSLGHGHHDNGNHGNYNNNGNHHNNHGNSGNNGNGNNGNGNSGNGNKGNGNKGNGNGGNGNKHH